MAIGLKICGLVRAQDVEACCELGVDALGFNLWSGSPRGLSVADASSLVRLVPAGGPLRVGVFVDPPPHALAEAIGALALDLVQLHGDRTLADYPGLSCPWIWVVRGTPELAALQVPSPPPQWVLLDAKVEGYGGRGVRHDWSWAARARAALAPLPVWLAGGVDPDNAMAAITAVQPAGLDVASGAELTADERAADGRNARAGSKSRARIAALRAICANVRP